MIDNLERLFEIVPMERTSQNRMLGQGMTPGLFKSGELKRTVEVAANLDDIAAGLRSVQGMKEQPLLHGR